MIVACHRTFTNESGNEIEMVVCMEYTTTTISISGPDSLIENIITKHEAENLYEMLGAVLGRNAHVMR